jgi:hypothetical protein
MHNQSNTVSPEICPECTRPLPPVGYFCGFCLNQYKCKACDSIMEKDAIGCTNCGTLKVKNESKVNGNNTKNTFRLLETTSDRTIEASFSDEVGKDLSGILRDAYFSRRGNGKVNLIEGQKDEQMNVNTEDIPHTEIPEIKDQINDNKNRNIHPTPPATPAHEDYPEIRGLAMRNLPNSEVEWVIVYAFYASDFGKQICTRLQIIKQYKEAYRFDSKTTARDLNVQLTRAVRQGFLNPLKNGYSVLEKGVDKVKEIISRTTASVPKQKTFTKEKVADQQSEEVVKIKKTNTAVKTPRRLPNLDLVPAGKESLQDVYNKYQTNSNHERNLLFVYFLETILNIESITFDHIYTCYDSLELIISENLMQTVRNTGSKNGWIEVKNNKISTTVKGRNQIKSWNKLK